MISIRYSQADLSAIWRSLGPSERIKAFKNWLGHPSNQPSLFIVDDLDGLKDDTLIKSALPREVQIILYSTRDPSLIEGLQRNSREYRLPIMEVDEMAELMYTVLRQGGDAMLDTHISEKNLEAIARVVDGHALAACRAISYIIRVLAQTTGMYFPE